MRGLLIICIGADVSDVRIGQADNLSGVTGIGEDFLVSSEAGVKNDFAAATGASPRRTALKDAPVLERENRGDFRKPEQ